MRHFKTRFLEVNETQALYDGSQLRSLYAYMEHGILGDSIVAWVGPCEVGFEKMVDGEDLREGSAIRGSKMLHLIIEKFEARLPEMVALQRLTTAIAKDLLTAEIKLQNANLHECKVRREGDDLYVSTGRNEEGKLSISIATLSPISGLIHFALNVSNSGTPVKTACLEELGIDPLQLGQDLLSRLALEFDSIAAATCKVKWVN